MGMIGAKAVPRLAEYLKHESNGFFAKTLAARSLKKIGEEHPEKRDECVGILANQLARYSKRDPELNGFIVGYLIDLGAVESMDAIEKAYGKDCVDPAISGDLEDVEIELGLKKQRTGERAASSSKNGTTFMTGLPKPSERRRKTEKSAETNRARAEAVKNTRNAVSANRRSRD